MSAPSISSISPSVGAPGTVITVTGSGFDPAAQVGCPVMVATAFTSSTSLQAAVPTELQGSSGGSMTVVVFVRNPDSSISNMVQFTVRFPAVALQSWTTLDAVGGEVPNFARGGQISDDTLRNWMVSISQSVSAVLLRRGLSLDPTQWAQGDPLSIAPSPVAVLEQITRYGAAARLASAISSQFSGGTEWGFSKNLQSAYEREFRLLSDGHYDKLFRPAAATVESGQLVSAGEAFTFNGGASQAFTKDQVF